MGRGFLVVAVNLLRTDSGCLKPVIQQYPGTGAPLPVDVRNPRQVLDPADSFGIALLDDDSLDTLHPFDQRHTFTRDSFFR